MSIFTISGIQKNAWFGKSQGTMTGALLRKLLGLYFIHIRHYNIHIGTFIHTVYVYVCIYIYEHAFIEWIDINECTECT